ncbi:class I SAM-dependent methyltransferase [Buchnera aphidicola (Kurisakia onigurumii)]|uniref:class I SAM-dependent methyltransferase n=1 Tax=Buchnera aphidicola TaxID=9 RepID=UPI0031B66E7B
MEISIQNIKENSRFYNYLIKLGINININSNIKLILNKKKIKLYDTQNPKLGNFYIDFTNKKISYRINNRKKESLIQAIKIKNNPYPNVLDMTAGLGRDSFILAASGCHVLMLERNPIIFILLNNALHRAYKNPKIGKWVKSRIKFFFESSFNISNISFTFKPEVIYIDPMYCIKKRKSNPKKDMQFLNKIIKNTDQDSNKLIFIARNINCRKIVVKRPLNGSYIGNIKTKNSIFSKKHRFDIYQPILKK